MTNTHSTSLTPQHKVHSIELGPMENLIYLIEDIASQRVAVVDPAWDASAIIALANQHGLTITDILLTHSHHDHINAIDDILLHHDAQLHLTHAEAQFWGNHVGKPTLHYGGDSIAIGKTQIEVLHTPGHTPGSACYQIGDELITGDTMFVFGCGRCDLPGGDPNIMFNTLNKLKTELPDQTIIRPGHNYAVQTSATFAEQKAGNPFFHFDHLHDFVNFRMNLHGKVRSSPYAMVSPLEAQAYLK